MIQFIGAAVLVLIGLVVLLWLARRRRLPETAGLEATQPPVRVVPPFARVEQGDPAFFRARRWESQPPGASITKWLWEGPAGQTGYEPSFQVDTARLEPSRYTVRLTVTDNQGRQQTRRAALRVSLARRRRPQLERANLIRDIHLDKTRVRSGEYFRVTVETGQPTATAGRVDVNIHGRWANPRVLQLKGGVGRRKLRITAVAGGHFDERTAEIEVVPGVPDDCFQDFYVWQNPRRKRSASFRIFDAPQTSGAATKTTYHWDFGDGQKAVTTTPYVTHDYGRSQSKAPHEVFQVSVRSPDLGRIGWKTVSAWDEEGLKLPFSIEGETRPPLRPWRRDGEASDRTALVLSGGGAKGAFQVGVVRYLYDQGLRPAIITGTSVGALSAAKLAEGDLLLQPGPERVDASRRLEALWLQIRGNEDIYIRSEDLKEFLEQVDELSPDFWDVLLWIATGPVGVSWSYAETLGLEKGQVLDALSHVANLYDQDGLQNIVERALHPELVAASKILLRVGSVDISRGQLRYFTEEGAILDERFNEISPAGTVSLHRSVLASSAIPGFFKRVRIGTRDYVDGALREDVPLRAALELNPTDVIVVSTSPAVFETAGLVPLEDLLPEDVHPRALDIFMRSIEIMGDEVARQDVEGQRDINWTLREVFTAPDPGAGLLLTEPPGPETEPVVAGRRLLTYPLGHRLRGNPPLLEYVVPRIAVIEPLWSPGEVYDFERARIHAAVELGKRIAELRTTEIPGGRSLEAEVCDFVRDKEEESRPLSSPIHEQHVVWMEWAFDHCGGLRQPPCAPIGSDECVAEMAEQYADEEEREYWEEYCTAPDGTDWCAQAAGNDSGGDQ